MAIRTNFSIGVPGLLVIGIALAAVAALFIYVLAAAAVAAALWGIFWAARWSWRELQAWRATFHEHIPRHARVRS